MATVTGLVEKKNTKSPVWHYFAFEADASGKPKDIDKPKCKLCQEDISPLRKHQQSLHAHQEQTSINLFELG